MVKRTKWGRRKNDNRVAKKADYALIQDAASGTVADVLLPERQNTEAGSIHADASVSTKLTEMDNDIQASQLAPTSASAPRIFALMGATGGVGTTSLATQLAHEFAVAAGANQIGRRAPTDPTVCLIDLDFESGACAHQLDLLPSLSLEDLCGPAENIDTAFTQALVSTHECGVSLLAAPNTIGANARINPYAVMAMLDAAADLYDTVIIDMPRYHQAWTLPVMRAVDVLGITCELTIPSLHSTRERLVKLAQDANGGVNAQVILGKYERRSFKNILRLADAETAVGRNIMGTLCLDPDTTREALNCGEPAGAIRPDSRFVKDVRKIALALRDQKLNSLSAAA